MPRKVIRNFWGWEVVLEGEDETIDEIVFGPSREPDPDDEERQPDVKTQ